MKVTWLVDYAPQDYEAIGDLKKAIEDQGHNYVPISYRPFQGIVLDQVFKAESGPIVLYCSLQLAREVQRTQSWVPGAIANFKNFECTTYYAYFGKYLLNDNYRIAPLGDIRRIINEINQEYESEFQSNVRPHFFIRPNNGFKSFTGQIIRSDRNYLDLKGLENDHSPELLCVLSAEKRITKEYRYLIVDKTVVTGSVYKINGRIQIDNAEYELSEGSWEFAQKVATGWEPDRAYCMDIAEDGHGGCSLIEINSFSCSGLYKMDMNKVVTAVSKAAANEWWLDYGNHN